MAYKVPGTYVEERQALPRSIPSSGAALPTFLGYTEKAADSQGNGLHLQPTRIESMMDFVALFGGRDQPQSWTLNYNATQGVGQAFPEGGKRFFLYDSVAQFFQNGGGLCQVVACGSYRNASGIRNDVALGGPTSTEGLSLGLAPLETIAQPMLISIPEAVHLDDSEYKSLMDAALAFCADSKRHFTLLDELNGFRTDVPAEIARLRGAVGTENLAFGAAYAPWVKVAGSYTPKLAGLSFYGVSGRSDWNSTFSGTSGILNDLLDDWNDAQDMVESFTLNPGLRDYLDKPMAAVYQDLKQHAANGANATAQWARYRSVFNLLVEICAQFESLESHTTMDSTLDGVKAMQGGLAAIQMVVELLNDFSSTAVQPFIYNSSNTAPSLTSLNGSDWLNGDDVTDFPASTTFSGTSPSDFISFLDARMNGQESILFQAFDLVYQAVLGVEEAESKKVFAGHPVFTAAQKSCEVAMQGIPASGSVAGRYNHTDANRGTWQAPGGMSLAGVAGPTVLITDAEHGAMNVDATTGKSVNGIRQFTGAGTLIWGARTLDGNSNDWRYVSVRRYMSQVEYDIQQALAAYVFEPNDANLWQQIKTAISNYLTNQWKQGALQGSSAAEAFDIQIGLGTTMTIEDILEGKLFATIALAVVRPAEFIVLRFSQFMQS